MVKYTDELDMTLIVFTRLFYFKPTNKQIDNLFSWFVSDNRVRHCMKIVEDILLEKSNTVLHGKLDCIVDGIPSQNPRAKC